MCQATCFRVSLWVRRYMRNQSRVYQVGATSLYKASENPSAVVKTILLNPSNEDASLMITPDAS